MNDQMIEKLWQSLISDGLAGVLDGGLEAGRAGGLLAAIQRESAGRAGEALLRNLTVQQPGTNDGVSGFTGVLQGLPIAGGLLRRILGNEETAKPTEARRYRPPDSIDASDMVPGSGGAAEATSTLGGRDGRGLSPSVVINISAMDSRSILDRSDDIASAVRQAMLTYQPFDDLWQ